MAMVLKQCAGRLGVILLILACTEPPPPVGSVSLSLSKDSLFVGETSTATAAVEDEFGLPLTGRTVTWTSATTTVATVSTAGVITAVGPGTSVITATSEGKSDNATIKVLAPVSTISVTTTAASINVGQTTQATAVLKDASGNTLTGRPVAWSSSATSVATVSASGLVSGVGQGTTTITASAEGKTRSTPQQVVIPVPGSFNLSGPSNRSANNTTKPDFSWGPSSGAATYTIEIATTSAFGSSTVLTQSGLTTTSFTPTNALDALTVYFWRVTAVNGGGSTTAANGPREFSTVLSAGRDPAGIAVTPDGTKAFVMNSTTNGTVSVVNLATKSVIGTIPVGGFGGMVVMRPDGAQAVAAGSNTLYVIDVATNSISKTIPMPCVATTLYGIAYTPDGSKIVAADLSNGCTAEGVRLVTIATGASQFSDANTGNVLQWVAVMPNGTSAFVTSGPTGTSIRKVNLSTLAITNLTGTGVNWGIAATPDNAAVLYTGDTDVWRLDVSANSVSKIATFSGSQIAVSPDGSRAIVCGDFDAIAIQLSTNTVTATYPNGCSRVAFSPDSKYVYFTTGAGSGTGGTVRVFRVP